MYIDLIRAKPRRSQLLNVCAKFFRNFCKKMTNDQFLNPFYVVVWSLEILDRGYIVLKNARTKNWGIKECPKKKIQVKLSLSLPLFQWFKSYNSQSKPKWGEKRNFADLFCPKFHSKFHIQRTNESTTTINWLSRWFEWLDTNNTEGEGESARVNDVSIVCKIANS